MKPLLSVRKLCKSFVTDASLLGQGHHAFRAVDEIGFDLFPGETFGLVGESGCGKSTTAKLILRLIEADSGEIVYEDQELTRLTQKELRSLRRNLQMVFQDPYASLNPRMTIGDIVAEPIVIHGLAKGNAIRELAGKLLTTVGLGTEHLDRYPHEFSGGQRQRICIARALALKPKLIVADEPVSALDLSIQAQIINLLSDIQQEFGLTYLFISHDLSVIEHICDRVAVMYLGRIVELAPTKDLYRAPRHPYTEALIQAVPQPDPFRRQSRIPLKGEVPSPLSPPTGCHFHPRCPYAQELCRSTSPDLLEKSPGRFSACHFDLPDPYAPQPPP